jgi:hypothetical protein
LNHSEVAISGRLANQGPGKKNQSEMRTQKETTNRLFSPAGDVYMDIPQGT